MSFKYDVTGTIELDSFPRCPARGCRSLTAAVIGRGPLVGQQSNVRLLPSKGANTKQFLSICPTCSQDLLLSTTGIAIPFLASDGVTKTIDDLRRSSRLFTFSHFGFTRHAYEAAVSRIMLEDQANPPNIQKRSLQRLGQKLSRSRSTEDALEFSQRVCNWGRSMRVWANMVRYSQASQTNLGQALAHWLCEVKRCSIDVAIAVGTKIPGLGISFASKHLRMMDPTRFPVLDEVLSSGLGYATNVKGYALFVKQLGDFKRMHKLAHPISTVEAAIFYLARPLVRQQQAQLRAQERD